ncbi:hypothetical protein Tco_1112929 [Tanacetum coccineum]|uniref:Uncharacterized protein n=1 Tax=Tanacetum coccineum TaxID=301880 RepID=A0ABQ5IQP8_9ASTR
MMYIFLGLRFLKILMVFFDGKAINDIVVFPVPYTFCITEATFNMSANKAGMTSDIGSKQAMSDKAASRKAANTDIESKKVTFPKVRHVNVELFLDQLHVDVTGTIVVMIGQKWDVSGNMVHCTARENVAYKFFKLKEGAIYSIKNFTVKPDKGEYLMCA